MTTADRRWRATALAAWVVPWTLCLAAVTIQLGLDPARPDDVDFFYSGAFYGLDVFVGLINGPASAVILSRSRHPVGWISALVALGFSVAAFSAQYALLAAARPGLPGLGFFAQAFAWAWLPGAFVATVSMAWLLREDRPGPIGLLFSWAGVVVAAVVTFAGITGQQEDAPVNPLSLSGTSAYDAIQVSGQLAIGLAGLLAVAGVVHLALRWRQESAEGRGGLGVVMASLLLLVVSFTSVRFAPDPVDTTVFVQVMLAALFISQILLPVSIIVVVLRHRMWGVDVAVSRAAVWGLLTAFVVALYAVLVWFIGRLLPWSDEVAGLVAAGGLALAVQPVRRWLQVRVDRLIYGSGTDPADLLASMGERLKGGDGRTSLETLVEGLRQSLRLGHVDVVSAEGGSAVRASAGQRRETEIELPLVLEGRRVGALHVSAPVGQRLDLRTTRAVEQMTGVIAVALDLAQANLRLASTADRLIEVRHEERRLLRRELHDGLGPALAGIGLGMAAARKKVVRDPDGTAVLLAELEAELGRRTDDLRQIARSLLPPALDDGDLAAALQLLASRFDDTTLAVTAEVTTDVVIDTRRQIAIYHVAAEALVNAYRHADASRVDVLIEAAPSGEIVLQVTDDGSGPPEQGSHGVGMNSMRERAEELGGEFEISSRDGGRGTQVRMRLP